MEKEILTVKAFLSSVQTNDFQKILSLTLEILKTTFNAQNIFFFTIKDERLQPFHEHYEMLPEEEQILIEYYRNNRNGFINFDSDPGIYYKLSRSLLIYNINLNQTRLGTILIAGKEKQKFQNSDLELVENIADKFSFFLKKSILHNSITYIPLSDIISMLIENTRLAQTNADYRKKLYSLLEVTNIINSSKKLEEMIQNILNSATMVLRAESASLFLIDEATQDLVLTLITDRNNLKGIRIPKGKGIAGYCAESRQSLLVNDVNNHPFFYKGIDKISQITTRNLIACPLVVEDKVLGVIEVINSLDTNGFTQDDLELFRSFSESVAIALHKRKLLDVLEKTNRQLEKKVRELTTLHTIAQILVEYENFEKIVDLILVTLKRELQIQYLSLVLYDTKHKNLQMFGNVNSAERELHRKLAQLAMEKKTSLFLQNMEDTPELCSLLPESIETNKPAIAILLSKTSGDTIGVLCATEPLEKSDFEEDDFRVLHTIGTQIAKTYESIEYTGIQKEIEITARIQKNILPRHAPQHYALEYAAITVPSKTTGGDFYEYYFESPFGNAFFLIADVSGKSLPAAIFMAIATTIIRTVMKKEDDPATILQIANDLLFEESESGMFVTAFLAKYDAINGTLEYASAGHNNMLLIHEDGSYEVLFVRGLPLGVLRSNESNFEKKVTPLKKNDVLVLFTDGVSEAFNTGGEEYGIARLAEKVKENRNLHPEEIAYRIYRDVLQFTGKETLDDDFTLLITKFSLRFTKDTFSFLVPLEKKAIPRLVDFVYQILIRYRVPEVILHDVMLVCDEVATNIISYAYENIPLDGKPKFKCNVKVKERTIILTFLDKGKKYDFHSADKPEPEKNLSGEKKGGFGIFLIRTLMDKVYYEHRNRMNILRLIKRF